MLIRFASQVCHFKLEGRLTWESSRLVSSTRHYTILPPTAATDVQLPFSQMVSNVQSLVSALKRPNWKTYHTLAQGMVRSNNSNVLEDDQSCEAGFILVIGGPGSTLTKEGTGSEAGALLLCRCLTFKYH